MKYVVYGATASAAMIYGFSLLFGLTGTTQLGEIGRRWPAAGSAVIPMFLASVMVASGFGYKIAAVPFHMWSPDVYEGAPTPATAFFSVAPKAAGFAVLIRFYLHRLRGRRSVGCRVEAFHRRRTGPSCSRCCPRSR